MKKIIFSNLLAFVIIILIMLNSVLAFEVNIDIKDSFSEGEIITYNFEIISEQEINISYSPNIFCPDMPIIESDEKIINLKKGIPYSETYTDIKISEFVEPQTCRAYIKITNPFYIEIEKNFSIIANPSFSFNIKLDKKIFLQGEDIYIDYDSEVVNPLIIATLIYPNKKTKQITLPGLIKANKIGTYELKIMASKEGYKTITKRIQFGVIEKPAVIKKGPVSKKEQLSALNFWKTIKDFINQIKNLFS